VTDVDREKWGPNGISRSQAARLLRGDLSQAEDAVNRDVQIPLTQNQFDALVSLAYNLGVGAFRGLTLLLLLNNGDYKGAAAEFRNITAAGSAHPRGLGTQREEERARFERR